MKHSSTTPLSVLALAIVTACGGGGQQPTSTEAVAAASPPPAAERVVTIRGREGPAISPAANMDPANLDSVTHIDPLVAQRVQSELDRIEGALRQLDDGKVEKHEALEIVNDARAELRRGRPNKLRLRGLLSGLAEGTQVLGVKGAGDYLPRLVPLV